MTNVKQARTMPYTPEQLFNMVDDIERYHEFLPYFNSSQVNFRNEDEVEATLTVTMAGFNKSFTTRNRLQRNKMIELRLVDGPFSHLEGFWRFDEVPAGCHVSFDLEFDFAGSWLSSLMGPMFEQVAQSMIDSFAKRAEELYG